MFDWSVRLLIVLWLVVISHPELASAPHKRLLDAPLLGTFASNLYAEYRNNDDGGGSLSDRVRSEIRRRIGDFVHSFRQDDGEKVRNGDGGSESGGKSRRRMKRDSFGYRGALLDSSKFVT